MKGLVLAGGHGTRLRPLTFTGNKHMIPIANRPILFYGLQQMARSGIVEVGIVLGPIQEGIRESIGDGSAFGLHVTYIEQGPPRGLAHAVLCARDFLGDAPFLMYLGDNLLEHGVQSFVDLFDTQHPDAVLGVTAVAEPNKYGVIELQGLRIVSIEEKPRKPRSHLVLVGVYVFSPKIHEVIRELKPSARGELEITDAIQELVRAGGSVLPHRIFGWWKDTGGPEDLLHANDLVLNSRGASEFTRRSPLPDGVQVHGSVEIGTDCVIEPGVVLEGPSVIGSGVRLTPGTSVGPEAAIGDGVELRGCSVRHSIVLEGARISGTVHLVDSLVGRNAIVQATQLPAHEVSLLVGDASRIRL
ncbi:MAG TPA: glucose-1-phosphate thymidylyltransferase [Thermoplasmata archaeon]|nr:glucose-1-phosphate thymidylyltransferase [Thermoplasmata archaeon]HTW77434.1 glucose-1-phosphate thymidylyltransferase [Thermoplasmata archaeon]